MNKPRSFPLDERLARDCHQLADLSLCRLLLMNNALLPWFILVPDVDVVELHELSGEQQQQLLTEINLVSRFVQGHFSPEKLNVAAIGNIVRQLHIHIVGRNSSDVCWPGVVWGVRQREAYEQSQLEDLCRELAAALPAGTAIFPVTAKP